MVHINAQDDRPSAGSGEEDFKVCLLYMLVAMFVMWTDSF